jgi:triacylglycerol lipase
VSAHASREDAPEWPDFSVVLTGRVTEAPPVLVGIVVRDAANNGAILGRSCIRVGATVTEGWFPLNATLPMDVQTQKGDASENGNIETVSQSWSSMLDRNVSAGRTPRNEYSNPDAEVFVRIEWPEYCSLPGYEKSFAAATQSAVSADEDNDMRSVSERPGRFFRCGELMVTVYALGVPVTVRDAQLVVKIPDQQLRGFEVASPSRHMAHSASDIGEFDLDPDVDQTIRPAGGEQDLSSPCPPSKRRVVKFGSFSFALFQGTFPEELNLGILERGRALPKVTYVAEQTILLPRAIPGFDASPVGGETRSSRNSQTESDGGNISSEISSLSMSDNMNSYVLHVLATSPGKVDSKISFDVRICYILWQPTAICTIVTPRFRSLLAELKSDMSTVKATCAKARELAFLFVGGLFTDHYPMYFTENVKFLREELGISNIQSVKIHTEASVESNAIVIKDAVLEFAQGRPRSVVLVGHSKGGVDVCSAIARFHELGQYIFGVISFQAPFSGTFLVDFLKSKSLAQNVLTNTIQNLWGGDGNSVLDIGYDARFKEVVSLGTKEIRRAIGSAREMEVGDTGNIFDNTRVAECLRVYAKVPIIAFASCASFSVRSVRTVANAAGFASMAPMARIITRRTGFCCDGLVSPCDSRIPYADVVQLDDMMHTEPALYFNGSKYAPGFLTAASIVLLFEKIARQEHK